MSHRLVSLSSLLSPFPLCCIAACAAFSEHVWFEREAAGRREHQVSAA